MGAKQGSAIGRVLAGRYRVEAVLGRGAMGSVYRAVDQENNRVCAIKLMHQFATLDDRAYLRFVHEAQIVAQLYHPNIVQVWGFDRDEDGTPIMAMEFLEGQDLHTYLGTESKIPLARVLEVVRAVGGALHAAHAAGVLHRDIKPKNIFLSHQKNSRGEEMEIVKVVDFGLSKVLGMHHANETAPGTILGTAEYVAPESTLGMPELIDFRADQWALGVVAYRMLSGRLPYEAPDVITLLLTIRQAQHTPLRELVRDVPAHVVAAIDRAMAKSKEDRFDTVQDFLRALDGLPPVGHVLSMSSDGVPAVAPPEWAKRGASNPGLGFGVNSNSGRISLSGATHLPVSSASGRHAPSSSSGRHAPSSPSGRFGASTSSGRYRQSTAGDSNEHHPAPGAAPGAAPAPSATSGKKKPGGAAALEVTDELAALGAVFGSSPTPAAAPVPVPASALPLPPMTPLTDAHKTGELYAVGAAMARQRAAEAAAASKGAAASKVPEGSSEYSVHVNGHLVDSAGRAAAANGSASSSRPLWPKLLAPVMLVLVGGLIYLSVSNRAVSQRETTPSQPPAASPPETALRPSPVPSPAPPAAPPAVSPAAAPPAVAPPVAPAPVAATPPVAAPQAKPGVPPRPQPGAGPGQGQWAKGGRPGAWRPGARPANVPKQAPGAASPQRPPVVAPTGDPAGKTPATATAPAATPPKEGPKEGDAPHRISVVD